MANKFFTAIRARFFSTVADTAVDVGVDGDTNPRIAIDAGGKITWGDGTAAVDTNLYRDSANVLKTDDTFKAPVLFVDDIEIDTTGATSNQVLQYNGTKFLPATVSGGGGGATDLDGLTDVTITSPAEFQTLAYDGSGWVNNYSPLVSYVRNAESTTLTVGTVVYLFSATGDHASVKRADNDSDTTSSKTMGVVAANIAASANGPVVTRGYVDGIDLSTGYTAGDILYLGEDGGFTKTKPTAPEHLVFIGVVVRATNNGIIYVATQNGYELDELHNVAINSGTLANGDVVRYNSTSGLWENSQAVGPTGPQGPTGPTGSVGATGPTGPTGPEQYVTVSDTAPVSPALGEAWYNSSDGRTYIYYNDGNTNQWVEFGNANIGPTGPQGATGPQGDDGFIAQTSAPTNTGLLWLDTDEPADVPTISLLASQTFTSSTTYTLPSAAKIVILECIGAGGGGGGGARNTGTFTGGGGGGGGGGPYERHTLTAQELGGGGSSVTVTIGAGGTGGTGRTGSTGNGINGTNGGVSRFGTLYFGYGSAGNAGTSSASGGVSSAAVGFNMGTSGIGSAGSANNTVAANSGLRGGGGGGGAGGRSTTDRAGATGGTSYSDPSLVTAGGGGAGGAATGGNGSDGAVKQGGGGGGSSNTTAGGNGGNGGVGGGGGGGAGANGDNNGGNGGDGGRAEINVWVYG